MNLLALVDGAGIYGSSIHYVIVVFFVGVAFILFLYLWSKDKLSMDEEPKLTMMQSDTEEEFHE